MSQYEKHSWCLGIILILTAIFGLFALFAFETKNVFEWLSLFNICFFAAIMVGHCIAPRPKECTEDEKRLSDKASAWTFYGMVTAIFIAVFLEAMIIPETITITVTKNTTSNISIFAMCMVVLAFGVQSLLLAVFLRHVTKQNGENKEPENDVWERIKK